MAHGKEGDGQARAKEKDEVGRQLVPVFSSISNCIFGTQILGKFKFQMHLLLMAKGRLSPGAGRPSPPRLKIKH